VHPLMAVLKPEEALLLDVGWNKAALPENFVYFDQESTNHYYHEIIFWCFDALIDAMFIMENWLADAKTLTQHSQAFHHNLATDLMEELCQADS